MVAVTNVSVYLFLTFLDLTCHLEDTGMGVLCLLCCMIVGKPNMDVLTMRLLHQYIKIMG